MQRRRLCALFAILLVELVGLGYFIKGFFPYKKSIAGFASRQDQAWDIGSQDAVGGGVASLGSANVPAKYDRLVIMLVDALRNDFVFGNSSGMAYTQAMLRSGKAIGFTAKALAPTVTMPRIKALMTGTVPNFLDAVLNIAESDTSSSLRFQDNLLWQLRNHGNKTINMFGDDTWLRLFPDLFTRTDGTSSFFVADTVEVDLNVTRHVRPELERDDWDVTIFHYLGLDHIGHLAGPASPLMRPKQQEMDDVVRDAFEIVSAQDAERMRTNKSAKPTLFVLLGDHAMNEIGNHGGNTRLETSTVFVFLGQGIQGGQPTANQGKNALSALLTTEVPQINLVPTLALLFGVPIPKNNLGMPLLELLGSYSALERLCLLQMSARQMFGVVQANDPAVSDVTLAEIESSSSSTSKLADCNAMEDGATTSDALRCKYLRALAAHRLCAVSVGTEKGVAASKVEREYYEFMEHANEHLSRTFSGYDLGAMITGISVIGAATLMLAALCQAAEHGRGLVDTKARRLRVGVPTTALLVTYLLSLAASSMIEEEHQFWYFWTQTMLALRLLTSPTRGGAARTAVQMGVFRTIRAWNQTGQKWTGEPDIRLYLTSTNSELMWALVVGTVVAVNVALHQLHVCLYPGPVRRAAVFSGAETGEQRALVIAQRMFRALVAYASFGALVYQLDRSHGWQALGVGDSAWVVVRSGVPPDLAYVARVVYACTGLALGVGAICVRLRARTVFPTPSEETRASGVQAAALDFLVGVVPVLLLLSRPHNIPLFALFMVLFALFWPQLYSLLWAGGRVSATGGSVESAGGALRPSKLAVVFCLLNASFFALGNSNSLASLDLSNAYAGVSRYSETMVGVLMFVSNWAGPIWWAVAGLASLALSRDGISARRVVDVLAAVNLWQACTLLVLSAVVALLRTHLFIWSVFSPRYLYQVGWLAGFYLLFVTCGGLLWLAGVALAS
ncbi:major facilitator super transporter protein [Coemansia thaxteri]|uniref:GPI ethanolamine phosphate transferase 2 n=1 Tax=Coemansia thaxteri TaxID=2663907 RepID=A0A9W8EGS6_9FUNG|nr:major facilitator super transporter protein [Coemansia thaxteri]KAJ2007127.1 major facilitator super transporter protein [Coemansia thaxteri]KAJ2468473.1 major facilitator super transporter protein [Coemansia sp. RSA 2322]